MNAVASLGPELDDLPRDANRAPVRRAGHVAIPQPGLQRFESDARGVEVVDCLALPSDVGLEPVAARSRREQLLGQLADESGS